MADIWSWGPAQDSVTTYASGDQVPHRSWLVYQNGVKVGEVDVHLHRRKGADGVTDTSFGATFVAFGPPQEGS